MKSKSNLETDNSIRFFYIYFCFVSLFFLFVVLINLKGEENILKCAVFNNNNDNNRVEVITIPKKKEEEEK